MKKYEALFIFSSSLKDEALDAALQALNKDVEKFGGQTLHVDRIGVRTFARRMKKKDSGCYVRATLEMDPAKIAPLQARLKRNEDLLRSQIVVLDERARQERKRSAAAAAEKGEANHG